MTDWLITAVLLAIAAIGGLGFVAWVSGYGFFVRMG
jgi:hypothetical protein